MLINLRNALMAGRRLPYDAEVEYLESTGTQWIDTEILGSNALAFHLTAKAQVLNANFFCGCIGSNGASEMQRLVGAASGGVAYYVLQRGEFSIHGRNRIVADGNWHTYKLSSTEAVIDSDTKSSGTISDCNRTFLLFAVVSTAGVVSCGKCCISACKIWDNGALVRDYIPVRKGTVGYLYDRVSGKLFGNAGTGDFVLGQDVVPVEWLSSDGEQYIDTGYVFQFGDDISTTFQPLATPTQTAYFFGADTAYNAGLNVHYDPSSSNSGLRYCYGGGLGSSSTGVTISPVQAFSASTIYACNGNANKRTINSGENTASAQDSGLNNASVILFCGRRNASVRPASTGWAVASRFFGFDAKRNGAGVRAMKPVRVGTEGAMMDVLTRRIYRNQGTGAFTYGNDLKYPIPA